MVIMIITTPIHIGTPVTLIITEQAFIWDITSGDQPIRHLPILQAFTGIRI